MPLASTPDFTSASIATSTSVQANSSQIVSDRHIESCVRGSAGWSPPLMAQTDADSRPWLLDPLQHAHIVRDRRAAHVENAGKPGAVDLDAAGRIGQLH